MFDKLAEPFRVVFFFVSIKSDKIAEQVCVSGGSPIKLPSYLCFWTNHDFTEPFAFLNQAQ